MFTSWHGRNGCHKPTYAVRAFEVNSDGPPYLHFQNLSNFFLQLLFWNSSATRMLTLDDKLLPHQQPVGHEVAQPNPDWGFLRHGEGFCRKVRRFWRYRWYIRRLGVWAYDASTSIITCSWCSIQVGDGGRGNGFCQLELANSDCQ